jgi:hypothetical protein
LTRRRYIAFWSYTRFDDQHDGTWLTGLKVALESEFQAQSGVHVEIFQDVDGIVWGEQWRAKLKASANDAAFLIPIITPNYFQSDACRAELEQFVDREKATGLSDLILPLYYINCSQLQSEFVRGTDWLARVVADHNYLDLRPFRHQGLKSSEVLQAVGALATALLKRLNDFERWHLSSPKMEAHIIAPAPDDRVPRKALILGTLREVSEWIDVWLVVEVGARYHPQKRLSRDAIAWQATVILGREHAGVDSSSKFPVHVLAVTGSVTSAFERYLTDGQKRKEWSGVPKPPDSKVLATVQVVRDDSATIYRFMEGVYDEHGADGTATGGMVDMKLSSPDIFATEAKNRSGKTEWVGTVRMVESSEPLRGEGTYTYPGRTDSGVHRLTIDATTGDLEVAGRNVSTPGGSSFHTVWKRRG